VIEVFALELPKSGCLRDAFPHDPVTLKRQQAAPENLSGAAYGAGIQIQRNGQLRIRNLVDLDQACAGRLICSAHDSAIAAGHEGD
jgi:hypothetical protein